MALIFQLWFDVGFNSKWVVFLLVGLGRDVSYMFHCEPQQGSLKFEEPHGVERQLVSLTQG